MYDAILSVLYRKHDKVISLERAFYGIKSNATYLVVVLDYLSLQVNYDTVL